jgi:hypothetical protein
MPSGPVWHSLDPHVMITIDNVRWSALAVILMAGWCGRLGIRLRASAHAPLRSTTCDTAQPRSGSRRVLTSKQIQALLDHQDVRPVRPPPARHGRGARGGMDGVGRAALVGGNRLGRHDAHPMGTCPRARDEIGGVTVKPTSGVAFQGRDRSTHNAPSPRGCCRGTLARGYALTSSEPRRRRR